MKAARFIYRYKETGVCVTVSRSRSREATWDFAIKWLRPCMVKDDAEAERIMREIGEVVREENE